MALIAIDPGKVTGVAVFEDNRTMVRATAGSPEYCILAISDFRNGTCVVEIPQVYPGQQQKGDQNDLIALAVMVGRYVEYATFRGFRVKLVKPREWKGQLPKDVCWKRVRETLTPVELANMAKLPKSKAHNMHDAIGLGTWFQKRWR